MRTGSLFSKTMNNIFLVFFLTSLFFVNIECQVLCNVNIGFQDIVPWIDLNDMFCSPAIFNEFIPHDFSNTTDSLLNNYVLTCMEKSLLVIKAINSVDCNCSFANIRTGEVTKDLFCTGFLLVDNTFIENRNIVWIILAVAIFIILVIISLVTLSCVPLLWIVVRKKKSDHPFACVNPQESIPIQNVNSVTINPLVQSQLHFNPGIESVYAEVNFKDYDYVDIETENLYSFRCYTNNSEDLYRKMRETKPVRISADLEQTIENQISHIRTNSNSTNVSGTVSYVVVPTLEQRKLSNSNHNAKKQSLYYTRFVSMDKAEDDYLSKAEAIYWEPSDNVEDLYIQMSNEKLLEINKETISIQELLGSGEFGEVNKGIWQSPVGDLNVAVKVMNQDIDKQSQTALLQEAAILGQFSHPNILRLVGVVTLTVPNMIVTELMHEELKRFLIDLQTQHNQELDYETIAPHFLSVSRQVASGMQHLAERGCIHRDIAARNILLTDKFVCKIADFGMSRRLQTESDYYKVKGSNKLPVKWSAPEAVFFKRFTLKSDVWSYGMLLYEIWSVGRQPWPYEDNRSTVEKMARGVNLPPPSGCSRAIYELMVDTWHPRANQRPDMKDIVTRLSVPNEMLLVRTQLENRSGTLPPAFMLGADPIAAMELYKDLQNEYLNVNN
ncbi:hypothetical protein LOD99_1920 [Oopsacas minuta]|uniref:Protein kinase domain-containing protein n=1 Tax=Oopsacas minuta TaxID=111878 RepID=A0AAV7K4R7_9METZ|nr:hypothetical protein LOD99_1920 [Oopsacas minuta]